MTPTITFGLISLNEQFYEVVEATDADSDDILVAKMVMVEDGNYHQQTTTHYVIMKRGHKAS